MGLRSLLFPQKDTCLFCNANVSEIKDHLCIHCIENLEYLNREVKLNSPYLEKVVYSLFYNTFIREKLYQYKYGGKNYYYKPLGDILINTIEEKFSKESIDIIVYVPIHRRKKALRGYDQSELIAKYISESLDIPISRGNLVRTKWTSVQNKLDKNARKKNLEDAFFIKKMEKFKDKKILLIDDIITTGTTIEKCSEKLVECGVKKINALAITSGMKL